eukprot:gene6762-7560_t
MEELKTGEYAHPTNSPINEDGCHKSDLAREKKHDSTGRYYAVNNDHDDDIPQRAQVFLGGACNPTNWRQRTAIPFLKEHGITYFNPQVDDWFPELIEIEERAKNTADLLLFVFTNATTAIASMMEVAFSSVVVMESPTEISEAYSIDTDRKDPYWFDLQRGRELLVTLLKLENIPVFTTVEEGLQYCVTLISSTLKHEYSNSEDRTGRPSIIWDIYLGRSLHLSENKDETEDRLRKSKWSLLESSRKTWRSYTAQMKAQAPNQCSCALLSIDRIDHHLPAMVEAAYLIGKHDHVYLVLEDYYDDTMSPESASISTRYATDINRGRAYLKSQAKHHKLPIFSSIRQAEEVLLSDLQPDP